MNPALAELIRMLARAAVDDHLAGAAGEDDTQVQRNEDMQLQSNEAAAVVRPIGSGRGREA